MAGSEVWDFHKAVDQSCWGICTVLERRLTYWSAARTTTMQVLDQYVRIITMMELSYVNVGIYIN